MRSTGFLSNGKHGKTGPGKLYGTEISAAPICIRARGKEMRSNRKLLLNNKVAVITGSSGGIGRVIVKRFLDEGALVAAADIVKPKNQYPDNYCFFKCNVSDPYSVKRLIKNTLAKYGRIDILINAAAVQSPIGPIVKVSESEWIECITTNLIGTMLTTKYVLPPMIAQKSGVIINFSGGGATFPRPNYSAYASSKAAIVRFTETIAEEVRKYGIKANSIAPGSVYTNMLKEIIAAGEKLAGNDYKDALKIKHFGGDLPESAAGLCVFLALNKTRNLTGKLISAVWDDINQLPDLTKARNSLYTLRRIDNHKYVKKGNK